MEYRGSYAANPSRHSPPGKNSLRRNPSPATTLQWRGLIVGHDFNFRRNLLPWLVPDAKETAAVAGLCERGITLEQKFIERFWRAACELICQRRAITE